MATPITSRRFSRWPNFETYRKDFRKRHLYDMLDKKTSLRTHLDTHATKHLDTRIKSLETLGDKLIEMDMCVQNKSKDVFYTEEGEAYIHRQQDLFIYKVLRDMHKDVYVDSEDLLPWSIDRDGDFIMYVKDIASTGAEADEADRLGEQLVGLRS